MTEPFTSSILHDDDSPPQYNTLFGDTFHPVMSSQQQQQPFGIENLLSEPHSVPSHPFPQLPLPPTVQALPTATTTTASSKNRKYSVVDLPATCNWRGCEWSVQGSTESMVYRHALEQHCQSGKQVCLWNSHPNRPFELCETALRNKVRSMFEREGEAFSSHIPSFHHQRVNLSTTSPYTFLRR
jgi:hypothetical protein